MNTENPDKGTYKIASEVIAGIDLDTAKTPTLFEGVGYKVVGPLKEPFASIGVLIAQNQEKIHELIVQRSNFDNSKYEKDLQILNFILGVTDGVPQALVDMPPSNFICMDSLQKDQASQDLVEKILKLQQESGAYEGKLEARDFWIDTRTNKLFFVALHKLKV